MQASTFLEAFPCLELVLACRDGYNAIEKCIHVFNGEVLVYVRKIAIMGIMRIPPKEVYEYWTIISSYAQFSTNVIELKKISPRVGFSSLKEEVHVLLNLSPESI